MILWMEISRWHVSRTGSQLARAFRLTRNKESVTYAINLAISWLIGLQKSRRVRQAMQQNSLDLRLIICDLRRVRRDACNYS